MAYTNLNNYEDPDWVNIEDSMWRKNAHGMDYSGQNGVLIIDDAVKAEGPHRVGRYLLSGVPVYRDTDGNLRLYSENARTAEEKIVGFLQSIEEIGNKNGRNYDQKIVGIQTAGEIYPKWLPVELTEDEIPARFGQSIL